MTVDVGFLEMTELLRATLAEEHPADTAAVLDRLDTPGRRTVFGLRRPRKPPRCCMR